MLKSKFLFSLSLAMGVVPIALAQNTFPATGNVGIGTNSPAVTLHVNGVSRSVLHELYDGSAYVGTLGRGLSITGAWSNIPEALTMTYHARDFAIGGWGKTDGLWKGASLFINSDNGSVGIGTESPFLNTSNKGIQVSKGGHSSVILGTPNVDGKGGIIQTSDNKHRIFIGANLYDDENGKWKNFQSGKGGAGISILADENNWGTSVDFYLRSQDGLGDEVGDEFVKMRINSAGDVGIGTTTPREKLSVNGKIRAHEIKVEIQNWPDYVFERDYKIPSLTMLESYIKDNKHLPGFPSASETSANGIAVGELIKALLKNQEELTLLLIEKDKELSLEKSKNNAQELRLEIIEKLIKNRR